MGKTQSKHPSKLASGQDMTFRYLDQNPELYLKVKTDLEIKVEDLKSRLLQAVLEKKVHEVYSDLANLKSTVSEKQYEYDVVLAFWLAIHQEDIKIVSALLQREFIIRQLVAAALQKQKASSISQINGDEAAEEKQNENEDDEDEEDDEEGEIAEEDDHDDSQRHLNSKGKKGRRLGDSMPDDQHDVSDHRGDSQYSVSMEHEGGESEEEKKVKEPPRKKQSTKQSIIKKRTGNFKEDSMNYKTLGEGTEPAQGTQKNESLLQPPANILGQVLRVAKQAEAERKQKELEESPSLQEYFNSLGLTPDEINRVTDIDPEAIIIIKDAFQNRFKSIMTNLLNLALRKHESKLACIIVVEYEIMLEEDMLIRAVQQENYNWLYYVWIMQKNYLGDRRNSKSRFVRFDDLFEIIIRSHNNNKQGIEQKIKTILEWRIDSHDNIIQALLSHHFDDIAIDNMGYYNSFLNQDLFVYCMTHGNNLFLRKALLLAAFDKMIFREDNVINSILTILQEGYRTNFLLNILSLIDISVWKNKHLKELIEIIDSYTSDTFEKNKVLQCPNPILTISLASEILSKIAISRRKFESECYQIQQNLLKLGKMYSKKIEDEGYYEQLMTSEDFKGRNLMKIITHNEFEQLMDEGDPKAENLMMTIWRGKEAARCDGDILGFSNFSHILLTKAKKGKNTTLFQIVSNFFQPNYKVNYSFQYRFRLKSINFYFYKELICALLMLIIFQYINYRYLVLFSSSELTDVHETPDENVADSINEYGQWNFFALFFSSSLLLQLFLKICFNIFSTRKVSVDKWCLMDTLSAILNIAAVFVIQKISPSIFLVNSRKDYVDYFMILVLSISWLRFFSYFLVVRSISKLLLTLIAMIGDTLSFLFLVACFLLIMASIFTTLYQDTNPDKYGGLALTVRTLFNAIVAQYDYDNMPGREVSHSLLTITNVFFTNIILMNYLIAILSSTYEKMRQSGIFSFKVNLYQYCERYLNAFDDRDYGELILHPPPLSCINTIAVPFLFSRRATAQISKWISYVMYWIENIFFIAGFSVIDLCLMPLAYCKVWFNLITNSQNFCNLVINCVLYTFFGPFIMLFILVRDIGIYISILRYHEGCKERSEQEITEAAIEDSLKARLYNEARATVIWFYKKIKKSYELGGKEANQSDEDEDDLENIPDQFQIEADQMTNDEKAFVVKKSLLVEEWKKLRHQMERKIRLKNLRNLDPKSINDKNDNQLLAIKKQLLMKQATKLSSAGRRQSIAANHWDVRNSYNSRGSKTNKSKDLSIALKGVLLDHMNKISKQENMQNQQVDMQGFDVPQNEVAIVEEFLNKFVIISEGSLNDYIDMALMLKALPNKIMQHSLIHYNMFNFRIFQESLIAFQNIEIVNAFEYFDEKNKQRVQTVKSKLQQQRNLLNDTKEILDIVKKKMEKNKDSSNYLLTQQLINHLSNDPQAALQFQQQQFFQQQSMHSQTNAPVQQLFQQQYPVIQEKKLEEDDDKAE